MRGCPESFFRAAPLDFLVRGWLVPMTLKKLLAVIVRILEWVADIFVVSVLWLLCCLLVVTVGAASAALYYTVVKVVRKERGSLVKSFFLSFRMNIRQSIALTLLFLLGCGLISLYILLGMGAIPSDSSMYIAYWSVVAVLGAIFFSTVLYAFPLLSRFENKTGHLIKNAFFLNAAHPVKGFGLLCLLALTVYILRVLPIGILFIPGTFAFLVSLVLEPVFRNHTAKGGDKNERDYWYIDNGKE